MTSEPSDGTPVRRGAEEGQVYLVMDGVELTMDVRTPSDPTPDGRSRPVVVLFHGASAATNDADDVTAVGEAAAAAGMVVFAPEWIAGDPFPLMFDDIEKLSRASACAVAFAQREAAAYGGDPARIVTSGFSAGTGPALTAAVASVTDDEIIGCRATPGRDEVVGAVLGDGEYFWHSGAFDDAFATNPVDMRQATQLFIDPSNWRPDPPLRLRLWAAAERTAPRLLAEPGAEGWLDDRDADGTLRSDLEAIGALDDASIDYVDSAALFTRRATAAGIDVELDVVPGGHTTMGRVEAIVEHLSVAAAES